MILFVSGTDTGIGKTTVTCALARLMRGQGRQVGVAKPIATGAVCRGLRKVSPDALKLMKAAGAPESEYGNVNPVLYDPPVSPHLAARQARRPIRLGVLRRHIYNMERRTGILLVEGVGGVATPLGDKKTWADFMSMFKSPRTLLVCPSRVGALNQTLMSLEYLASRAVHCAGLVMSRFNPANPRHRENLRELVRLTGLPVVLSLQGSTRFEGDILRVLKVD